MSSLKPLALALSGVFALSYACAAEAVKKGAFDLLRNVLQNKASNMLSR